MATLERRIPLGSTYTLGKVTRQAGDYFSFSTAKRGTILCHRDGAGTSMMGQTFSSWIRSIQAFKNLYSIEGR